MVAPIAVANAVMMTISRLASWYAGYVFRAAILSLCLTTTLTIPAWGQSQESRAAAADQEARAAFAEGEFKRAAERFEEANRLAPHAQLRYNAALAWQKAGANARAADGYEAALQQGGLDEQRAGKARTVLAALKQNLGYVKIPGPLGGTLSVAHLKRAPIPTQFHLTPGTHELSVERADGSGASKTIQVRAGEVLNVEVEAGAATLGPTRPPTGRDTPPTKDTPEKPAASPSQATWGWIALGSGVVLGGAAAYFGTQTLSASDDYEASNFTDADARDRGTRNRLITNIALGGAVVAVGVGSYLLLTSGSSESATRAPRRRNSSAANWSSLRF